MSVEHRCLSLLRLFAARPHSRPPSWDEMAAHIGTDIDTAARYVRLLAYRGLLTWDRSWLRSSALRMTYAGELALRRGVW